MINCHWNIVTTCKYNADQIIIYGCFQGHIREMAVCTAHAMDWLNHHREKRWRCSQCSGRIEEYTMVAVHNVKTILSETR